MYEIYTIKFGENIDDILDLYKIDMEELIKLNGIIELDNLKEGMQIIVPVRNNEIYNYYTVKKGDTLYQIADMYNVDVNLLTKINGLEDNEYIYPNQTLIIPKEGVNLYLTEGNDTLNLVLEKLNIGLDKLIEDNENIYLREEQLLVFLDK